MNHPRNWITFLLALLIALPLRAQETSAPAAETGTLVRESWSIILLQNKRCGFGSTILRERVTPTGKQYITDNHQEFKMTRQGVVIHSISQSSIVETETGTIVSFQAESHGAGSDQILRGYRVGDEMVILSGPQKARVAMPKSVLGPEAFDRMTRAMKMEPGAAISAQTFLADFPQAPVTMTARVVAKEKRDLPTGSRDLWKLSVGMSLMPGMDMTVFANDQGDAELVIMPFPGIGEMQLLTTTRAEAMKELESIELFTNSLVSPKQPLTDVRHLKSATFRLTVDNARDPLLLWSGPGQTVLESKPGQATVEVTAAEIDPKSIIWQLPHAAQPELAPYLTSSFYIEQTPRIRELAQQAVGGEKNPVLAARKIESFVRSYIQRKDLSVGFASADETAASRTGDCTEHGVLCAALARAVGLPSRVVVGFGYLPTDYSNTAKTGTFGFHMWAEAWVGPDQWVPMDAALGRFDVGHIAIAKTALKEVNPMVELAMPVLNLMQNLQIEVLSTRK